MYAAVVMFLSPLITAFWHEKIWCLVDIDLFLVSISEGPKNGLSVLWQ